MCTYTRLATLDRVSTQQVVCAGGSTLLAHGEVDDKLYTGDGTTDTVTKAPMFLRVMCLGGNSKCPLIVKYIGSSLDIGRHRGLSQARVWLRGMIDSVLAADEVDARDLASASEASPQVL